MNANKSSEKKLKQVIKSPLPMRDGVSASRVWLPKEGDYKNGTERYETWDTVLDFLIERFPFIGKEVLIDRMQRGEIVTQAGNPVSPTTTYLRETFLFYYREVIDEVSIPFKEKIIFKDENIIAVDKPHFIPVTPSGKFVKETLLSRLKDRYQSEDISPIHRLDRETAGVMLFSCNHEIRGAYQHLFQQRLVNKTYEAIAPIATTELVFPHTHKSRMTRHDEIFFIMQEVEGEANSETLIDLIETQDKLARYHLSPLTGRQHQLRVHLASLDIPILHDSFYPELQASKGEDYSQPLQLLAKSIEFFDPLSKEIRRFESQQSLKFP